MLEKSIVEDCARRLEEAELSRQPLPQFSLQHPDITIEDAYSIQKAWMALRLNASERSLTCHRV